MDSALKHFGYFFIGAIVGVLTILGYQFFITGTLDTNAVPVLSAYGGIPGALGGLLGGVVSGSNSGAALAGLLGAAVGIFFLL